MDKTLRLSIDEYRIACWGYTLHGQIYPPIREPHFEHYIAQKLPFDSVVCFTDVKFDRHVANLDLSSIPQSMQHLVRY